MKIAPCETRFYHNPGGNVHGNASLMGSFMVVVSRDFHQRQENLAQRMTSIDLSNNPGYMEEYIWKDEPTRVCSGCNQEVPNPRMDVGCAKWCSWAEECLGGSGG